MKSTQCHTRGRVRGLWLFDSASLAELDKIVDDAEKEFVAIRKTDLEKAFKLEQRSKQYQEETKQCDGEAKKRIDKEIRQILEEFYLFGRDVKGLGNIGGCVKWTWAWMTHPGWSSGSMPEKWRLAPW